MVRGWKNCVIKPQFFIPGSAPEDRPRNLNFGILHTERTQPKERMREDRYRDREIHGLSCSPNGPRETHVPRS